MEHKNANESIQCSVNSCAHHCQDKNCCTLQAIKVGCCDASVSKCDQTQCASFDLGDHGTSCCR